MDIITRFATPGNIKFLSAIQASESDALGFVPASRLEVECVRHRVIVAKCGKLELGYCYFGSPKSGALPIFQMVVEAGVRRKLIADALLQHVRSLARDCNAHVVRCSCRADLEANAFWRASGFFLVGQREGGVRRGIKVNEYVRFG